MFKVLLHSGSDDFQFYWIFYVWGFVYFFFIILKKPTLNILLGYDSTLENQLLPFVVKFSKANHIKEQLNFCEVYVNVW